MPMTVSRRLMLALIGVLLLMTGCDSQPEVSQSLPTLMDLNSLATQTAAAVTAVAESQLAATATRIALSTLDAPPTLPPTWTPSPPSTQNLSPASAVPTTSVPPSTQNTGTLYYIYNSDSIAAQAADGSFTELVLAAGAPSDLALSPDGNVLAYAAQGSGAARSVYIMDADSASPQRYTPIPVTCQPFARIQSMAWSEDGTFVAFAAAVNAGEPLAIYIAQVAGACPDRERQLTPPQFPFVAGVSIRFDGQWVAFASERLYLINLEQQLSNISYNTGYGPDFGPRFRPGSTELYYIKTTLDEQGQDLGGRLAFVDTADPTQDLRDQESRSLFFSGTQLDWDASGDFLLLGGTRDVQLQDMGTGVARAIVLGSDFPTQPVFSPDARAVAYIAANRGQPQQQIFIVSRNGANPQQITRLTEGTILNLVWSPVVP
jgi:Tol biopolymer transport system component